MDPAQVLAAEADWLERAHRNAPQMTYEGNNAGYSKEYLRGFAAAAGWVRFHATYPHLIADRIKEQT